MVGKVCSVEGCRNLRRSKEFCQSHFNRFKKYGHPEGGGTKRGDLMRFFHEVVVPYTGKDCLIWPYTRNGRGYGQINVGGGKRAITSRLVCEVTYGPPPTPAHEASHSCGNGHLGCVSPLHLRWATSSENKADKVIHDTHNRGERCNTAKLTEEQVLEILTLKGREVQSSVAKRFGITRSNVSAIYRGKSWAWLQETGQ